MIAMMAGAMIIFRGVAYLFGFVWLAQLVEHLVYTKLVQKNKNSNNLLSITIIAYLIEQL